MATMPAIPSDVPVKPVLLSREQRGWLEQAVSRIDEERMRRSTAPPASTARLVRSARPVSGWCSRCELGTDAFYQPLDERSGNAVGQLKGTGGGPALLLYAPIDTHLRADPHEDVPGWTGIAS